MTSTSSPTALSRAFRVGYHVESTICLLLLGTLVFSCLVPVVLRILGIAGLAWAQPLSTYLVLWVAILGAGAATRDRKHIAIDAIGQFLPPRGRLALRGIGEWIACAILVYLVPHAQRFVADEKEFTEGELALWGIPAWWLPAVIPAGLCWLALRLLLAGSVDLWRAIARKHADAS